VRADDLVEGALRVEAERLGTAVSELPGRIEVVGSQPRRRQDCERELTRTGGASVDRFCSKMRRRPRLLAL